MLSSPLAKEGVVGAWLVLATARTPSAIRTLTNIFRRAEIEAIVKDTRSGSHE